METLDRPARLAFEDHYLVCPQCASVVASTDEYVRSMRTALERLRMERKMGEGGVACGQNNVNDPRGKRCCHEPLLQNWRT